VSRDLSPELYALLSAKLDTFEKLELVLALRAARAPLTLADLALQLQVGREALRRVLDDVVDSGLLEPSGADAFRLLPGRWDPQLEEAAVIHAAEPTKLMRAFTRLAMERIRGMAARTFADAFRIRKKGD
jgi:DNA-binding IclR family transcriptional regulator